MTTGRINQVTLVKRRREDPTTDLLTSFFRHQASCPPLAEKKQDLDQEVLLIADVFTTLSQPLLLHES